MEFNEFIRKLKFMVNVGTDFDYKKEYQKLAPEVKKQVDEYLAKIEFTFNY